MDGEGMTQRMDSMKPSSLYMQRLVESVDTHATIQHPRHHQKVKASLFPQTIGSIRQVHAQTDTHKKPKTQLYLAQDGHT